MHWFYWKLQLMYQKTSFRIPQTLSLDLSSTTLRWIDQKASIQEKEPKWSDLNVCYSLKTISMSFLSDPYIFHAWACCVYNAIKTNLKLDVGAHQLQTHEMMLDVSFSVAHCLFVCLFHRLVCVCLFFCCCCQRYQCTAGWLLFFSAFFPAIS